MLKVLNRPLIHTGNSEGEISHRLGNRLGYIGSFCPLSARSEGSRPSSWYLPVPTQAYGSSRAGPRPVSGEGCSSGLALYSLDSFRCLRPIIYLCRCGGDWIIWYIDSILGCGEILSILLLGEGNMERDGFVTACCSFSTLLCRIIGCGHHRLTLLPISLYLISTPRTSW